MLTYMMRYIIIIINLILILLLKWYMGEDEVGVTDSEPSLIMHGEINLNYFMDVLHPPSFGITVESPYNKHLLTA